jgi:hypothetical protein
MDYPASAEVLLDSRMQSGQEKGVISSPVGCRHPSRLLDFRRESYSALEEKLA